MMKRMFIIVAVTMAFLATTAMATPTLYVMPLADAKTDCKANAVTPDGKYVAGTSGGLGVFWSVGSGSVVDIIAGGVWAFTSGTGIATRTVSGNTQIVVQGLSAGWGSTSYSTDNGATWLQGIRATSIISAIGNNNTLRSTGTDDVWYDVGAGGGMSHGYIEKVSGQPPALVHRDDKSTTSKTQVFSVSATGLAVGMRVGDGTNNWNYKLQYNGGSTTATYFRGLAGVNTKSEAWGVSGDGTRISGWSVVSGGRSGMWGYVYDVASDTITELPTEQASTGVASNSIAYGMGPTGDLAVGMDYTKGLEKAVLWYWNTGASAWKEIDLTDYAIANGILGSMTGNLRRAFSVGYDATNQQLVVVGQGYDTSGYLRGFALKMDGIPEPGTIAFLLLGGVALLRRR